jgi:hypothetical protein
MKKIAMFAFSGEPACFAHVMLNAIEIHEKGHDVKVVIEGDSTKLLSLLRNETKLYADVYRRFKSHNLIDCVCKACATRNSVVPAIIEQGLRLVDDGSGHPSMNRYLEAGYEIVTL